MHKWTPAVSVKNQGGWDHKSWSSPIQLSCHGALLQMIALSTTLGLGCLPFQQKNQQCGALKYGPKEKNSSVVAIVNVWSAPFKNTNDS